MKKLLEKEIVLFLQLDERSKKITSPYARMLFQENVMSYLIIATLRTIALFLNKKITDVILTDQRKIITEKSLEIEFNIKELEDKMLGSLYSAIQPFFSKEKELKKYLKDFITSRNKITHKMFKYEELEDLDKEAEKVVKIGENSIKELNKFRNKLQTEFINYK